MKSSSLFLHIALILAVVVSAFFTWQIWAGNARFQRDTSTSVTTNQTSTNTNAVSDDVYLPTNIYYQADQQQHLLYNTKESLIADLQKQLKSWNFGKITSQKSLSLKQYLKLIQTAKTVQLSYSDTLSYATFKRLFDHNTDSTSKTTFNFNRVLFQLDGHVTKLIFLDDNTRKLHTVAVTKGKTNAIKTALTGADLRLPVEERWLSNRLQVFYTEPIQVQPYAYLFEQQAENNYLTALFDQSVNSADVDTREDGENTIYSQGSKHRLLVNHETNQLIYNNYAASKVPTSLQALLQQSFDRLGQINNPMTNVRYFEGLPSSNTVVYRSFVEGFPVFSTGQAGSIKVMLQSNTEELSFSNYILRVPVPASLTPVTLPTTQTVLDELEAVGYTSSQIQQIEIGYRWTKDADSDQVIDLQPAYYIEINDTWKRYSVWLKEVTTSIGSGSTTPATEGSLKNGL